MPCWRCHGFRPEWTMEGPEFFGRLMQSVREADKLVRTPLPTDENWMRVAPGTDAAIWRPWSRETGEL